VTISIPTDVETIFHILLDLNSTRKTWDKAFRWGNILNKVDNDKDIVQIHSKPILLGRKVSQFILIMYFGFKNSIPIGSVSNRHS
jgi:hypothetical protein